MIKSNEGSVQLKGTREDILADLATLIHALHFNCFVGDYEIQPEESREMIMNAVEMGFKSEDELDEKHEELKNEFVKVLDELRNILIGKDEE